MQLWVLPQLPLPRAHPLPLPPRPLLVQDIRPAIFAMRAFNVETALVADQVRSREPTLLQVRSLLPGSARACCA